MAHGLWPRFRLLALAIDREDRFVAGPEEGGAKTVGPGPDVERAAEELVLRSLRVGTEAVNLSILRELSKEVTTSFSDLLDATGLDRLTLGERVNDLIQVGLAAKDVETRSVSGTPAAAGLLGFIDETRESLVDQIRRGDET
jgi:DNA-binding IclR family transcriptional regulator